MTTVFFSSRRLVLTDSIDKVGVDCTAIHKYSTPNELRQFIAKFAQREELQLGCIYYHDEAALLERFKEQFVFIEAAGGLVQNDEGKYLVIDRRGHIDLPKGKREAGETHEQNALREVKEETGIDASIVAPLTQTWHTYPLGEKTALKCTYWYAMHSEGTPKALPQIEEDIVAAIWVEKSELIALRERTYASLIPVFDSALKG